MKKQYTTLVLLMGLLLLSGCSRSFESQFKSACRDSGGNRAFCSCFYEQVSDHYGKDKLEAMTKEQTVPPRDYNETVMKATYQCAAKQL